MTSTAREIVDEYRAQGKKVGLVKLRFFRPYPFKEIQKIAEKTKFEAGIEWMRAFDRVAEEESFFRTMKIAQVVSRDNFSGYNIALIFGLSVKEDNYDINQYDDILKTGHEFNNMDSEVFARIYAGL